MGKGFFNLILFLKTQYFHLTFLTLAQCNDDISLSSSLTKVSPWERLIWGPCVARLLFFHAQTFTLFHIKRGLSLFLLTSCRLENTSAVFHAELSVV